MFNLSKISLTFVFAIFLSMFFSGFGIGFLLLGMRLWFIDKDPSGLFMMGVTSFYILVWFIVVYVIFSGLSLFKKDIDK